METTLDGICSDYIRKSSAYKAFIKNPKAPLKADGISNYPISRLLKLFSQKWGSRLFAICATEESAKALSLDLADVDNISTLYYPSSGKMLYSYGLSSSDNEAKKALMELDGMKCGIIVTSLRAFISPVLSRAMMDQMTMRLCLHDGKSPEEIASKLAASGYERVNSCYEEGTYTIRGEMIDVYPFGEENPVRINTEWDEITQIRFFDALSQKTVKELGKVDISLLNASAGESYTTFESFIRKDDYFAFIGAERLETSYSSLLKEAEARYKEAYRAHQEVKSPSQMLFAWSSFIAAERPSITLYDIKKNDYHHFSISPSRSYFGNVTYFKDDISTLLKEGWSVYVLAPSSVQKDRLDSVLKDFNVNIIVKDISSGFVVDDESLLVVLDNEIFGRKKHRAEKLVDTSSSPLDSFVDLKEGDYVVHVNYGIGRFVKIDRVKGFYTERDYIKIEYADKEFIYVPIEQANLVQKYIGSDQRLPKLEKLGSSTWSKKKERALKSAEELAKELVRLYAQRENSEGFPFSSDNDWQLAFEASFPFSETPDQIKCLEEIKKDMETKKVMDRLVCGDVGYGKTELAFRAAFKAVLSGKQVAFLAPTVILAEQHYNNFKERLGQFPVNASLLTRFVPSKNQKKILSRLKEGDVDVLFGTHKILNKIEFKDLGLLIVDEEQRFGVKDKEKIKQLKTNIDCLTLSATPIPRTLYMSLLKVRDMSLLTTAPRERLPIETYIEEFDFDKAVKAMRNELERGGQVFFLHNRIEDIDQIVMEIRREIPEAIVEYAHGQMEAEDLEDVMHRFIYEGVQILVSTTIIENGIDIPNVNTIIIDRAERLGLSQLYQLRGRVGRSDKKAYCYLFYKDRSSLNDDALKRLRVMSENTALGSGFKIAMKDMEIRGAGNILGREQSGHLEAVGLDMYMKLLDEEIDRIRGSEDGKKREVLLELDYSGFIPDSYISNSVEKFEIYKKIASVKSSEQLESLRAEIEDRFGPIPEDVDNLLCIAEIKILAASLDIYNIKEKNGVIEFELSKVSAIDPGRLVNLIQLSGGKVNLDPKRMNYIRMKSSSVSLKDKALFILEQLRRLK